MSSLLRRGFGENGYAVDVAANGADALWLATEAHFDAVVLDLMLPDMDGFKVCRSLREAGCWAPVLMLTARDAVADRVRGVERRSGALDPPRRVCVQASLRTSSNNACATTSVIAG